MDLYKIDELGKKWNKSVNDILRLIAAEKLKWWFRKPVIYSFQNQSDLYKLGDPFVAGMFLEKNDTSMMYCHGQGEPCEYYLENFVIFSEEVARVEAEYPDLLKQDTRQVLLGEQVQISREDRKNRAIKEIQKAGYDPFEPIRTWKRLVDATKHSRSHLEKLCPEILDHDIRKEDENDPQSKVWLFKYETALLTAPRPIKRNRRKK